MQVLVRRLHRGLAYLILAGLAAEVYLVGTALFRVTTFEPHRILGWALAIAIVLLLVLTIVAERRGRSIRLASLLVALMVVQWLLPGLRAVVPWVAALHAINTMALMGVTAAIARAPRTAPGSIGRGDSEVPHRVSSAVPPISSPERQPAPLTR